MVAHGYDHNSIFWVVYPTMKLTFDDVLIEPGFNTIESRKDVDLSSKLGNIDLELPIISANMDTVTGPAMACSLAGLGAVGCLHRFCSIEQNVVNAEEAGVNQTIASIGIGGGELERASALYDAGVRHFCIDVAHGASLAVVKQLEDLKRKYNDVYVIVGNFASVSSLRGFMTRLILYKPDAIKVGVGPGSACTTRIKTGIGFPQLSAVQELSEFLRSKYPYYADVPGGESEIKLIADGGMRTPGDIAKALAAGADFVMLGGMLAGTEQTPGQTITEGYNHPVRLYRGSASKESYEDQGKDESWRTAEGEAFTVPYKGSVAVVLQDIEGGLRSSLTYVGAQNLEEFRKKANFIRVSGATLRENGAHGKE